ncbi:MAG: TorF family putative porin [Colwellia sp.]|nr:TorF family putative porin [Colwellia sp.]MCW8865131.1 TorF family putative porin [Colwellia sp.]MCW9081978.1 TorF family putative porin [Colwellia sp.]
MKKSLLSIALTSALATSAFVSTQASAVEGLSANAAVVSQYFFRGIAQTTTASASAGVDYEVGNFSVGTWAADVQDGIEIDFYGAYGNELENGLGYSLGFTSYQYTGDFDSAYNEVNLGLSYDFLSVSYNIGQHDEDAGLGIDESDYDFLSLTAEYEGFYATYGTWGKDFDGDYVEVGYGAEVSGFDLGVALIVNSKELDVETAEGDETLVFSISKSF